MGAKNDAANMLRDHLQLTIEQSHLLVSLLVKATQDKERCFHCGHLFKSSRIGQEGKCEQCRRDFDGLRRKQ